MRTTIRRSLIALLLSPVALGAAIIAVNLRDEPLRAEVRKIWDEPVPSPSETGRRSYLYLLGLAAGERADPEKRGADLWPHANDPSVMAALDSTGWAKTRFEGCEDGACGVTDLDEKLRQTLVDTKMLTSLYAGWMDYADFAFLQPPLALPGAHAHRLYLLRLSQWLEQGGRERVWASLANANQFYSRLLASGPLATRALALANLAANARFVREELARSPAGEVPDDVRDAWRIPDLNDIFGGAVDAETKRLHSVLADLGRGLGRLGLRPHETANRIYEILNQRLFTDCARADRACVPALDYAGWSSPLHWIVNPRGRALVNEVSRALAERPNLQKLIAEISHVKAQLRPRP